MIFSMTGKDLIIQLGRMVLPPGQRSPDDEGFFLNDKLLPVYKKIYNYYLNQELSIQEKIMPNKGLMFCGGVGRGKTIAMRVMQQMGLRINGLEERQMCIITVNDFLKVFKEDESEAFSLFGFNKKMEMCIDELGWEASQKHYYGNDTSAIIGSWIMERNKLFVETGIRTHFTTNLLINDEDADIDLLRLYGSRIIDREREMVNVINWVGGSLRK